MRDRELEKEMNKETLRGWLRWKSLEELYTIRGEQYGSKDGLIEEILNNDNGTLLGEQLRVVEDNKVFKAMHSEQVEKGVAL